MSARKQPTPLPAGLTKPEPPPSPPMTATAKLALAVNDTDRMYAGAAIAACEAKASRINAQSRVPMDGHEITEAKMREYEAFRVFLQARAERAEALRRSKAAR